MSAQRAPGTLRRTGATLLELLVALSVTGVLATAVVRMVVTSLRVLDGLAQITDQRSQLTAVHGLVTALLSDIAPGEGDLVSWTDSAYVARGPVAVGLACPRRSDALELPPASASLAMVALHDALQPGDSLSRWDEGPTPSAHDDRWVNHRVVAVGRRAGICAGTALAPLSAAGLGWSVAIAPALPDTTHPIVVRIWRRQRVALYRSGSEWAAGFADWNGAAGRWNGIQPVAGPLAAHRAGAGGLSLAWLDSAGAPSAAGQTIVRLRGTVRAPVARSLRIPGRAPGVALDSLGIAIAFRNRP